jgi:hypothetical protein
MTDTAPQVTLSASELFKRVRYSPHVAQKLFHRSTARHRVAACGRRFGKSEMGAAELDIEAIRTKYMVPYLEDIGQRREFWIVGPEYTDSEKEFRKHYDAMKRIGAPFDKPGTYYNAHDSDMQISMFDGKYLVIGKSGMHPERLVGEGLSGVIMAEAAKLKERIWTKSIRPTLADFNGWSIHTSTPEGKNWFYKLYQRGIDPNDTDWNAWRFGSWRNPFVFPGGASAEGLATLRLAINDGKAITPALRKRTGVDPEIIDMMMDLTEETFNQEVAALFTEFTGRVFKKFDEEYHVRDVFYNPALPTYAAVDYGFTDPFVWLLIQEDPYTGVVYVVDELYESYLSIDDAARKVYDRGLCPSGVIEFMPDPASPGDTLALERHLKVRANRNTGGELNIRLRYIREALKDRNPHLPEESELREPKLQISRRCVNLIRELQDYRYPDRQKDQKGKDAPLDKDNHAPEALGRFYRGRYGDPSMASTGGGARVAGSTMSGSRRRR